MTGMLDPSEADLFVLLMDATTSGRAGYALVLCESLLRKHRGIQTNYLPWHDWPEGIGEVDNATPNP